MPFNDLLPIPSFLRSRPFRELTSVLAASALCFPAFAQQTTTFEVDLDGARKDISPLIYGLNDWQRDDTTASINYTLERMGGNRMTGYNWENNYSNAGEDYINHSDVHIVNSAPVEDRLIPGQGVRLSVDHAMQSNRPSLVTLQLAGYVAADDDGTVSEADVAPSTRWKEVRIRKEGALSLSPDLDDDYVYLDEQVNFLIETYGTATEGGVYAYSLDNEPSLWPHTHPRIHPELPTVEEIVDVGAEAAAMVKDLDPDAMVFGPALYGYGAYVDFSAPDWSSYENEYDWFISAYLGEMKKKSEAAGKRLLDVLDIHYYPEVSVVTGTNGQGEDEYTRITDNSSDNEVLAAARLQAPRSLWDSSYVEESWVTQWITNGQPLNLFPEVFASIEQQYPETLLSISEYDYGGRTNYSGGLAQADVLGIYGRDGVYAACFWGEVSGFITPAFQLYRNYDGQGSGFGGISIPISNPEIEEFSCYASVDPELGNLHVILINKTDSEQETTIDFGLASLVYDRVLAYGFSEATGPELTSLGQVAGQGTGALPVTLPARSATHYIFESSDLEPGRFAIESISDEGVATVRFRPSSGPSHALQTSTDLQVWQDLVEAIPADGIAREYQLPIPATKQFWKLEDNE